MKITVIAHPNSKKPCPPRKTSCARRCRQARVEKDLLNILHVYVNEPPLEGKANNAVREVLAKYYNVRKSLVILLSGKKSKNKLFKIVTK